MYNYNYAARTLTMYIIMKQGHLLAMYIIIMQQGHLLCIIIITSYRSTYAHHASRQILENQHEQYHNKGIYVKVIT